MAIFTAPYTLIVYVTVQLLLGLLAALSTGVLAYGERVYTWAEHEWQYAPLNKALSPAEAAQFGWKTETGTIQTYQHAETNRNIHIDGPTGQFYNQARNPISREAALDHSMPANCAHTQPASVPQNSVQPSVSQSQPATDQNRGYSL